MKLIITENKLHNLILNYIEDMFPVDDIHYTEGYDDDGNPDDTSYTFYFGDYEDGDDIFRWYGKDYWSGSGPLVNSRVDESPLLAFNDSDEPHKLDSLFGDKWKPVFKEWFTKNFGLEVKTIY